MSDSSTVLRHEDVGVGDREGDDLVPVPCLICGQLLGVKTELDEEIMEAYNGNQGDALDMVLASDIALLQYFFTLFQVKPDKDMALWICEPGKEQLPFCKLCKHRLSRLMKLQQKLEVLSEAIRSGTEVLKQALRSSEDILHEKRIYEVDKRYYLIRRHILGRKVVASQQKSGSTSEEIRKEVDIKSTRRSPRPTAVKTNTKISNPASTNIPFVLLSADDRILAEESRRGPSFKEQANSEIKEEYTPKRKSSNSDFDDDEHDAEPDVSSDPDYIDSKSKKQSKNKRVKKTKKVEIRTSTNHVPRKNYLGKNTKAEVGNLMTKECFREVDELSDEIDSKPKKRMLRQKPQQDEVFVPSDVELTTSDVSDGALGTDEEDDDHDFHDRNPKPQGRTQTRYKFHFDRDTGNARVRVLNVNITLEMLPNTELGSEQFKCKNCSDIVVVRNCLRTSMRNHIVAKHTDRFKCQECGKQHNSKSYLKDHIRSTHKKCPFPCTICGRPFVHRSSMLKHKLTHLNEEERQERNSKLGRKEKSKLFQCEDCGYITNLKLDLKRHRIRVHGTAEEKATLRNFLKKLCPECGKRVCSLKTHMESEHPNPDTLPRFPCLLCERRFNTARALKYHHNAAHTKEGPLKCDKCTKTFHNKSQLRCHTNSHLNIRPFQCGSCPMAFFQIGNLKRHVRIYHEEGSQPRRNPFVRGPTKKGIIPAADLTSSPPDNF